MRGTAIAPELPPPVDDTTPELVLMPGAAGPSMPAWVRVWRSFLKCATARSVKSVRLPPLTTSSPSGVTSSESPLRSWRRYPDFSRKLTYSANGIETAPSHTRRMSSKRF